MSNDSKYDYEILSTIRDTEKTSVYLASVSGSDDPVIVKVLKECDTTLASKIASLISPYLPKILHIENDGTTQTVIEEYIGGEPLDEYVKKNNLDERHLIELVLQICEGLRTLHTQIPPIIHRDLKPSNILVTETDSTPMVKIIDFDASREFKPDKERDTRALGTDSYAPPEQFGYSQTDVRSDIYSLGTVIGELTEGMSISKDLKKVISKSTMFNPDQRYADIGEMAKAIRACGRKKVLILPLIMVGVVLCALAVTLIFFLKPLDAGEVSEEDVRVINVDTTDPDTGASVDWTYYYMKDKPELSPIVMDIALTHGEARDVRITSGFDKYGKSIPDEYWSEDDDGFVRISDEYLQTLEENISYTIAIDFTDVKCVFNLMSITDLSVVKLGDPVMVPGYKEYIFSDPKDLVFHLSNTFGRKLISLKNADTGKELGEADYHYDEKENTVIIPQDYLNGYKDGDYINIEAVFEKTDQIKQNVKQTTTTIRVRNEPYIEPKLGLKNVAISSGDSKDLTVPFVFNSAKGKLEGVFIFNEADKNTPPVELDKNEYTVNEDDITIKGSHLSSVKPGRYRYGFEFGDVMISMYITVS